MANGSEFVDVLEDAGIRADLETETPGFAFDTFEYAWEIPVGVTTARMAPETQEDAKAAVREAMWPKDGGPRYFSNLTQYVVGEKVERGATGCFRRTRPTLSHSSVLSIVLCMPMTYDRFAAGPV